MQTYIRVLMTAGLIQVVGLADTPLLKEVVIGVEQPITVSLTVPPPDFVVDAELGLLRHEALSGQIVHRVGKQARGLFETRAVRTPKGDLLLMFPEGNHYAAGSGKVNVTQFAELNQPQKQIRHVIIEPASAQVPRSDTASIAELGDGRLMVAYHKYEKGRHAGHDQGVCRIWSKVSDDNGQTWKESRMLVDVTPGDMNVQAPGLVRLKSGKLLLNCLRAHRNGASSTMAILSSIDEGKSFTELSPAWVNSPGQLLQGGASSLLELTSGRLLLPFHGGTGNQWRQKNSAWCLYSDDQGQSWKKSNAIDLPKRGAMEASVAELTGGRLVMSLRTQLGGPYIAHSDDNGRTWSNAIFSGLEGGESCTCLRRLPDTDALVLFFNNSKYIKTHHHYGERTPLCAALSSDAGKTWRIIGTVAEDPQAEYTNLDCFFTSTGDAVLTYMYAKPAWNRKQIDLKAALIPRSWFREHLSKTDKRVDLLIY